MAGTFIIFNTVEIVIDVHVQYLYAGLTLGAYTLCIMVAHC